MKIVVRLLLVAVLLAPRASAITGDDACRMYYGDDICDDMPDSCGEFYKEGISYPCNECQTGGFPCPVKKPPVTTTKPPATTVTTTTTTTKPPAATTSTTTATTTTTVPATTTTASTATTSTTSTVPPPTTTVPSTTTVPPTTTSTPTIPPTGTAPTTPPPVCGFADGQFEDSNCIGELKIPHRGTSSVLVLLVSFRDSMQVSPVANQELTNFFRNEEGDTFYNYYRVNSNGLFSPRTTLVQVQLSKTFAEYCIAQCDGGVPTLNIPSLVRDALEQAKQNGIALRNFDQNGKDMRADGYIDGLVMIVNRDFRGYADQFDSVSVDNVTAKIVGFVPFGTLLQQGDFKGTALHEFGHLLGYVDLYDEASFGGTGPMQGLSLMGGEVRSGNLAFLSAFERYKIGWLVPARVASSGTYDLSHFSVLQIPKNASEYLLIEGRAPRSFYDQVIEPGVVVYHIDEGGRSPRVIHSVIVGVEPSKGTYQIEKPFILPIPASRSFLHGTINERLFRRGTVFDAASYVESGSFQGITGREVEYGRLAGNLWYDGTPMNVRISPVRTDEAGISAEIRLQTGEISQTAHGILTAILPDIDINAQNYIVVYGRDITSHRSRVLVGNETVADGIDAVGPMLRIPVPRTISFAGTGGRTLPLEIVFDSGEREAFNVTFTIPQQAECGNGVCEGNEPETCPQDCRKSTTTSTTRPATTTTEPKTTTTLPPTTTTQPRATTTSTIMPRAQRLELGVRIRNYERTVSRQEAIYRFSSTNYNADAIRYTILINTGTVSTVNLYVNDRLWTCTSFSSCSGTISMRSWDSGNYTIYAEENGTGFRTPAQQIELQDGSDPYPFVGFFIEEGQRNGRYINMVTPNIVGDQLLFMPGGYTLEGTNFLYVDGRNYGFCRILNCSIWVDTSAFSAGTHSYYTRTEFANSRIMQSRTFQFDLLPAATSSTTTTIRRIGEDSPSMMATLQDFFSSVLQFFGVS